MKSRIIRFLEEFPLASRRRIFIVYGIALIVGTHYPRLRLGTGYIIAPDRLMHTAAFGGLTILMMLSHFFQRSEQLFNWKNIVICGILAFLWGGTTEITQHFFVPGRTASASDVMCNSIGILAAIAVAFWLHRTCQ